MNLGPVLSVVPRSAPVISESYRELNRRLHENPSYGITGKVYAQTVRELMVEYNTSDVLDYGCGKRTLEEALGFPIANYDPCLSGLDAPPTPHDIVVCGDVLEHIEPECLADVLADLRRVTRRILFATIDQNPSQKILADGRNAHLIQQGQAWWLPKIWQAGFVVRWMRDGGSRLKFAAA